jgi:hypothetical protein
MVFAAAVMNMPDRMAKRTGCQLITGPAMIAATAMLSPPIAQFTGRRIRQAADNLGNKAWKILYSGIQIIQVKIAM